MLRRRGVNQNGDFFCEDQKCSLGPKMQNSFNFFFQNRVFPKGGGGGSDVWELFPFNPVFSEGVSNVHSSFGLSVSLVFQL